MNVQPLKIVNASAGSGKTYSLVLNYLLLLFTSERSKPFAHVAAMTFTNKAAFEMKSRIIEALEQLSYPEHFSPTQRKMEQPLLDALDCSPKALKEKAKRILYQLLHRYEEFCVLTIDKFNLRLIRTFSKELNLPPEFEVIVDETQELEKVLEWMMQELGQPNRQTLTNLAMKFSESQLLEGETWDFKKNVLELSSELLKEANQNVLEHLANKTFEFSEFQQLRKQRDEALKAIETCAESIINYVHSIDLESKSPDISYSNRILNNLFNARDRILKHDTLITEGDLAGVRDGKKGKEGYPEVADKIFEFQEQLLEHKSNYIKSQSIVKSYFSMAFLQLIQNRLEAHRGKEKVLLISEFNALLSQLVQDEEAPFIYEKIGTRLDHFLLDEFQDTSRMQWLNLIPLIDESLAYNRTCFIVGDPKQSIYRFKNGLPEQFEALPAIYNPENNASIAVRSQRFLSKSGEPVNLKFNWRSAKEIVDFNNSLFSSLYDMYESTTAENPFSFYKDVQQEPKSKKKGYVEYCIRTSSEAWDQDEMIDQIKKWVDDAVASGFKRNEIAILGRKNGICNQWAQRLTQENYKVVSSESLMVDSDLDVKFAITYLQKRASPGSSSAGKHFVAQCIRHFELKENPFQFDRKSTERKPEEDFLIQQFGSLDKVYAPFNSLYALIVHFCDLIGLEILDNHYMNHLLDMAYQFDLKNGPDLDLFLKFYVEKGKKSAVQIPESEDTMQIMTIHKSKGLEFPVVLLPELIMNTKAPSLFTSLDDAIVKVSKSDALLIDELQEQAENLSQTSLSDELNAVYVALTRASERMCMLVSYSKKNPSPLANVLLTNPMEADKKENGWFAIGDKKRTLDREKSKEKIKPFHPKSQKDFLWFPDIALKSDLKVENEESIAEARRYGKQLHLVLAQTASFAEVESCVKEMILKGLIESQFESQLLEEVKRTYETHLNGLYSGIKQVWSEQSIMSPNVDSVMIPDKIIEKSDGTLLLVDFKTGMERKRDLEQVKSYQSELQKLFKKPVAGYLLYTQENKLLKVE